MDFDVIVVGSGGAGLTSAIAAREAGADVMLLEADSTLGGATRFSTGVVYAAGTSVQEDAGISDCGDAMYQYLMVLNQHCVRPAMMRYYADNSASALEWLKELGVVFPVSILIDSCLSGVRRGHTPSGFAPEIVEQLINWAGVVGVETALGTRVDGLILEEECIRGIRFEGTELRAHAVILATGGFGNNPEMIARFLPSLAYHGDRVWAVHRDAPFILGDGIKLGEEIGAAITGHDNALMLPSTGFSTKNIEAFLPPWIVAVNREGRRFMAEWNSYCVTGNLINEQTDRRCWAVFDHAALVANNDDTSYTDPYESGHIVSSWEYDSVVAEADNGVVLRDGSIKGLARKAGIDPVALAHTLESYNTDIAQDRDRAFEKSGNGKRLRPVREPPFYAVEVRPTIIGFTAAGLDTDLECRVLGEDGVPIPGQFAVGEVLGSYHGNRYGGGGMSVGGGIVFGRQAGNMAAAYACKALEVN